MGSNAKFLIKTPDGKEYGPFEQEQVVSMAKNRQITPECLIRRNLIPEWEKAEKVSFLRKEFQPILEERIKSMVDQEKDWDKMKRRMALRGDERPDNNIAAEGYSFDNVGLIMRTISAIIDLVLVAVGEAVVAMICYILFLAHIVGGGVMLYLFVILGTLLFFSYYVVSWSLNLQTLGQHFLGIVMYRPGLAPLYPGRAACYLLLTMVFGLLSPITFILTLGRGTLQEYLTSIHVSRLTKTR